MPDPPRKWKVLGSIRGVCPGCGALTPVQDFDGSGYIVCRVCHEALQISLTPRGQVWTAGEAVKWMEHWQRTTPPAEKERTVAAMERAVEDMGGEEAGDVEA